MSATSEVLFEQIQALNAEIAAPAADTDVPALKQRLRTLTEQHRRAQHILTEDRKALLRD